MELILKTKVVKEVFTPRAWEREECPLAPMEFQAKSKVV